MSDSKHQELTRRQWEVHVQRMVTEGKRRDELLASMMAANWQETDARKLIRSTASKERWKAVAISIGCALWAFVALAVSIGTYEEASRQGGQYLIWYGGVICGLVGAVYGAVRFLKIRA